MPTGDDVSTTRLSTVEFRIYAGLAVVMLGGALGYGIWTSWEPAGTALLFLGDRAVHDRRRLPLVLGAPGADGGPTRSGDDVEVPEAEEPYLPHASIWPLEVGGGMALTFCGLAMGRWILISGLVLLVHGLAGWILQSRRRG